MGFPMGWIRLVPLSLGFLMLESIGYALSVPSGIGLTKAVISLLEVRDHNTLAY